MAAIKHRQAGLEGAENERKLHGHRLTLGLPLKFVRWRSHGERFPHGARQFPIFTRIMFFGTRERKVTSWKAE
jgi:hypothetical protein